MTYIGCDRYSILSDTKIILTRDYVGHVKAKNYSNIFCEGSEEYGFCVQQDKNPNKSRCYVVFDNDEAYEIIAEFEAKEKDRQDRIDQQKRNFLDKILKDKKKLENEQSEIGEQQDWLNDFRPRAFNLKRVKIS